MKSALYILIACNMLALMVCGYRLCNGCGMSPDIHPVVGMRIKDLFDCCGVPDSIQFFEERGEEASATMMSCSYVIGHNRHGAAYEVVEVYISRSVVTEVFKGRRLSGKRAGPR